LARYGEHGCADRLAHYRKRGIRSAGANFRVGYGGVLALPVPCGRCGVRFTAGAGRVGVQTCGRKYQRRAGGRTTLTIGGLTESAPGCFVQTNYAALDLRRAETPALKTILCIS